MKFLLFSVSISNLVPKRDSLSHRTIKDLALLKKKPVLYAIYS
jgi:hypothetical protein